MMPASFTACLLLAAGSAFALQPAPTPPPPPPQTVPALEYDEPFFPGVVYDAATPTPESLLGRDVGRSYKAASHAELLRVFSAWADPASPTKSPRALLQTHGVSHAGRTLFHIIISSPENLARLDAIKADLAKLADPRSAPADELDRLAQTLPPVAWLAYTIHGDEPSGSDAAMHAAYHLIAATDASTRDLVDNTIIIIDPLQNPDGRDHWLAQMLQNRTRQPSVDDQSLLGSGFWPTGRMNHYLFDLNRDWIFGVHPETRGRIAAINPWHPVVFVDSHEMGSQDSFLWSPSREPVNGFLPERRTHWWTVFARDKADAFDRFGWRYYAGEWNEEWYPGYSSAWAGYRGAVGILYEQSHAGHDGTRRPSGAVTSYRQSVHQQIVATMTNIRTLRTHGRTLMQEFLAERRAALSPDHPAARRVFAIAPSANRSRDAAFLDLMRLQGFEVFTAPASFSAAAVDRLGRTLPTRSFPAGTLLIPGSQPEAALVSAMLAFDPRMTDRFLQDERRELLRHGRSKLYDITAWNITMLHDVDAYELTSGLPAGSTRLDPAAVWPAPEATPGTARLAIAFAIDGADDRSVALAARLLDRGLHPRIALKPFKFGIAPDAREFARGSLVIARDDNRLRADLEAVVKAACIEVGLTPFPIITGMGELTATLDDPTDPVDFGGEHFPLLTAPRIAVFTRGNTNPYTFGEVWFTIDQRLGARATYIDSTAGGTLAFADLRRYNVIVVPDSFGEPAIAALAEPLKAWVKSGGTLIAIGNSAAAIATEKSGFSAARLLPDVLDKLPDYALEVLREWEGRSATIDAASVWTSNIPATIAYPWTQSPAPKVELDELKRREAWARTFMPQGAIVAARADDRHWLTFGLRDYVPALVGDDPVLMAGPGIDAPLRLGVFLPDASSPERPETAASTRGDEKPAEPTRLNWATTPPGHRVALRMSGLLWPEAADRIAHSAALTREPLGAGQIILYPRSPAFRGSTMGAARTLTNALIYGPSLGASSPIIP